MVGSRRVKGARSARTEGARRATGVSADGAAVGLGALAPGQRWSASRKRDVVLRLLRGESLDAVSREVGLEVYRLEAWKARALAESQVAVWLADGKSLRDMATATDLTEGAIYWHLKQIYQKLPISRQVDLVRLVLSIAEFG